MRSYTIERLSLENINHLVILYKDVFKKNVSGEFLLKKYSTWNLGIEYIGYLAFTENNYPIAFYGVIPCVIQLNGAQLLVAQSADTMTHPNSQKQGLFILLAQKTYALAKENGIKFIFGFPNQNSFPGFVKLQWIFLSAPLKLFTLKTESLPFAKIIFKSEALTWVYGHLIKKLFYKKFTIDSIFPVKNSNGLIHDQSFIEYKSYNQTFFTKIDQAYLWIKIDGVLKIGFVNIKNGFNATRFIKKIKMLAAMLGCNEILFITSKNSVIYNFLSPNIQPVDSLPIGFYNLSEEKFEFEKITFDYCDIDIF